MASKLNIIELRSIHERNKNDRKREQIPTVSTASWANYTMMELFMNVTKQMNY